jgi:GNAT superfamily N-acetyltransferase
MELIEVYNKKHIKDFISLPFILYKNDRFWVPPLKREIKKTLINCLKNRQRYSAFILYKNNKAVARVFLGIDIELNNIKKTKAGYFSLFESVNDINIMKILIKHIQEWFIERDIHYLRGPVSVTGAEADENKGLLIDSFDKFPVFMTSYNKKYYKNLFENTGFIKDYDVFAYYLDREKLFKKNTEAIIEYAKKKFHYDTYKMDFRKTEKLVKDLKYILDLAVPSEWPDLIPPDASDIKKTILDLKKYADRDILYIARDNEKPVGFGVALPDYNQVLIHLNGSLNVFSVLKFLYYRKKINAARMFIIFVIPEYRKKGVSYALYHAIFSASHKKGYINGEGSTIGEENIRMRNDVESLGGIKYKTYRIYKQKI